jgi:hypothetical protein
MRLYDQIFEGISSRVYHHTKNFLDILLEDSIRGSWARSEKESKLSKNYSYFISVARSMSSRFIYVRDKGAIFELDGEKLSRNYAGGPVNYFDSHGHQSKELEDRIFLKEERINNFSKYIKRVYFRITEELLNSELFNILRAIEVCNELHVEYAFIPPKSTVPKNKKFFREILESQVKIEEERIEKNEVVLLGGMEEIEKRRDLFYLLQQIVWHSVPEGAVMDGVFKITQSEDGFKHAEFQFYEKLLDKNDWFARAILGVLNQYLGLPENARLQPEEYKNKVKEKIHKQRKNIDEKDIKYKNLSIQNIISDLYWIYDSQEMRAISNFFVIDPIRGSKSIMLKERKELIKEIFK